MNSFQEKLVEIGQWPLQAAEIETLQVNVGKFCNQTCRHCHVDAGPSRQEIMTRETAELVVDVLRRFPIANVDITGGAPELNPNFDYLVEQARALGRHVGHAEGHAALDGDEVKSTVDGRQHAQG